MQIEISKITIRDNRRAVDKETVKELAESIREIGLLNPIVVDKDNVLIAGAHRLNACVMLGWNNIEANVVDLTGLSAELAEIDENLIRSEIFYLDKDEMFLRRKEIYETIHPETRWGGERRGKNFKLTKCQLETDSGNSPLKTGQAEVKTTGNPDELNLDYIPFDGPIPCIDETDVDDEKERDTNKSGVSEYSAAHSFVADTASKIGKVEKTVYRAIGRAENLCPEAKRVIREKQLPKNQADRIAVLDADDQKAVAGKISSGEIKSAGDIVRFVQTECANLPPDAGGGKKHRIIYAFPPWPPFGKKNEKNEEENAKAVKKIFATPIPAMAAEEAVLFMWVPDRHLANGIRLAERWGFNYKSSFIWIKKRRGMGGGEFNAIIHEFLLIATKGNCLPDAELDVESVVKIEQDEYPGELKRIISRMFYRGNKLMLWGKEDVDGWDVYPDLHRLDGEERKKKKGAQYPKDERKGVGFRRESKVGNLA